MGRVLLVSLALHAAVGVALARLRVPAARRSSVVELVIASGRPPANASAPLATPKGATPAVPTPLPPARRGAPAAERPRLASLVPHAPDPRRAPAPDDQAAAAPSSSAAARAVEPAPGVASPAPAVEPAPPPSPRPGKAVNLFAPSALARAADISIAASPADRAWRPRHGVGGGSGTGGVDVGSFLAEDAARQRVEKGGVAPELRTLERRLDAAFVPSFSQADNSNKAELFIKQMRGFLRNPPKTGALKRGLDPTKETLDEKMEAARPDQAFFLGRRVEVFVRQKADGTILEMALRQGSGYRAFDDAALAAVEKALGGRVPAGADGHAAEVRTLWQLDATAYVVVSPDPELVFDESSGKHEWVYPLQKRVDHHVRLVAVY